MTVSARTALACGLAAAIAGACGGAPRPTPPAPAPAVEPVAAPPPAVASSPQHAALATPRTHVAKLGNGLEVVISEANAGTDARIALAFSKGAVDAAPGLAEFTMEALVAGADASKGRPSLRQAIAALGGIVRADVGARSTWLAVRVPGARWQEALTALTAALTAPALPRSQLDRIRGELVEELAQQARARPAVATAQATLRGEPDTASRLRNLLDRDPSEVGLFQARFLRPENATCALQIAGDPTANAAVVGRSAEGSLVRWVPPALTARTGTPVIHASASGLLWSPGPAGARCFASVILSLPDVTAPDAAHRMTLQACLTLDGTGGRLERLQAQRGLGHVRWTSELVPGVDHSALVLTAEIAPADAEKTWQAFDLARRSLRDVPPNASELELAVRRARLTVGLAQFDDLARLRVEMLLRRTGRTPADLLRELGTPPAGDSPGFRAAIDAFVDAPVVCIVTGGEIPKDATLARRLELLPPGFAPVASVPSVATPALATPWLARATEAVGGAALLSRLGGYDAEGRLQSESAPVAKEKRSWRVAGVIDRTRDVLGNTIETHIDGKTAVERIGEAAQQLSAREAALVRREMERHPLALLAAHCRGGLRFQPVAQRSVGDREMMVLQAEGDRFDRLRIHVDTGSNLIRVVETWETLADGTTVHLQDAWSDYRTIAGLRAPFRCITTQDDGQNRVEAVFTAWQPVLSPP